MGSPYISGNGEQFFKQIEALNLEGIVMKRKDSVYAFTLPRLVEVRTSAARMTMQHRIENWG